MGKGSAAGPVHGLAECKVAILGSMTCFDMRFGDPRHRRPDFQCAAQHFAGCAGEWPILSAIGRCEIVAANIGQGMRPLWRTFADI
jgi:hypothetical protein